MDDANVSLRVALCCVREVNKKQEEEYSILWKDSPNFVQLAAKFDTIIIPFAAVGADDAYDILMEVDDIMKSPLLAPLARELFKRVDSDLKPREALMPLTRIPGMLVTSSASFKRFCTRDTLHPSIVIYACMQCINSVCASTGEYVGIRCELEPIYFLRYFLFLTYKFFYLTFNICAII